MLKKSLFFFSIFFFTLTFISFAQKQKAVKTIIIDPGHGGADQGADGLISTEAQLSLAMSKKLGDLIQKELPDVKVLFTRTTDIIPGNSRNKNEGLRWRANFANDNKADLFIAIHLNASGAHYERRQVGTTTKRIAVFTGKGKRKKVSSYREVEIPVYQRFKLNNTAHGSGTYILARDWY
ncbi:MAG: N-acetylmuramoyl-L-alanine amidase, partial [Chitinophagaceae bacterium]